MTETIISPNVFLNESNQSLVQKGIQGTATAIVGPTVMGSPFIPTYVTSYSEYLSIFGSTFKSGSYYYEYFTSLAAQQYFQGGGQTLLVTRIISGSNNINTYASTDVPNSITVVTGSQASASFTVLNSDISSYLDIIIDISTIFGSIQYVLENSPFIATGSYISEGDNIIFIGTQGLNSTSSWANYVVNAVNTDNATEIGSHFTASYNAGILTFTSKQYGTQQNAFSLTHSYSFGNTGAPAVNFGGGLDGVNGSSFSLETIAWGNQMNNTSSMVSGALSLGTSQNVRWEIVNVNTGSGQFTLNVRLGNDTTNNKNILETWANLSLDPSLPNYISRVIGDQKPIYIPAVGLENAYIAESGSFGNASQYIRISNVFNPQVDSIDNNGKYKATQYSGTLPVLGSGSFGGSFNGGVAATNIQQLMNETIGNGTNYSNDPVLGNIQGFASSDYATALNLLVDKDQYQFNVLIAPGLSLTSPDAATFISVCEGRGDSIAPIDNSDYGTGIFNAIQNAAGQSSNYAATYYPWVQLFSSNLSKAVWVPPSVVISGVYAFNDQVGAEWFAPAGLNRGGIPSILKAERKLQQIDRDNLYSANVNPLATFPGNGVVVWGQKTLQNQQTALNRVNVRRLLIALKGFIGQIARNIVFEQNTSVTRNRFLAQVNPYLSSVVQRQGLYAYQVKMDDSNNTPDVIDRNQLVGTITIQPTKTAEFIILNFNVQPTGATFS